VVDLGGWVALRGLKPWESVCVCVFVGAREPEQYSGVGSKSEEGHFVRQNGCLRLENR